MTTLGKRQVNVKCRRLFWLKIVIWHVSPWVHAGGVVYAYIVCLALFMANCGIFQSCAEAAQFAQHRISIPKPPCFAALAPWAACGPGAAVAACHSWQLCREGACSSTKSVPVQIVRPWQAAGAGSTAGQHMQGMLAVPQGTSLLPLLRVTWRFPGRDDAMKMSSLPVVFHGPAVVPTAGTKYCHCFFFFFPPSLFFILSTMAFTAEWQQQEREMSFGSHGRTDPAQLVLLRNQTEKVFLPYSSPQHSSLISKNGFASSNSCAH